MILVDTSIWLDHLRVPDPELGIIKDTVPIATHPLIVGEVAVGSLRRRDEILAGFAHLPWTPIASHGEALSLIERHGLHGRGLGIVDVHLLASTLLAPGLRLWTRDRRLAAAAAELGIAWG